MPETMTLLQQLASSGVLGVVLVLALLALRTKDRELRGESQARIDDAQRMLELSMRLQKDVTLAVAALTEIVDKWEKREEERERLSREVAMRALPTAPGPVPR